jgi:ABC-type transporter MlaC component
MASGLQFCSAMKLNQIQLRAILLGFALSVLLAIAAADIAMGKSLRSQIAQPVVTEQEKQMLAAFDRHVRDYLKQRERVKAKLPPLSKDATPEQIDAYQKKFVESLRAMRAGTKSGYIFNPQTVGYFRRIMKMEVPPRDKPEIRETILEADTKGVPLKVNFPYPETKELTQIPPTLLLKLPQLPKEVKYRYVGRNLLLVDTDNNLIVDYMLDALP